MSSLLGGLLFAKYQPNNINYLYGYRTSRSMRKQDTWKTATKLVAHLPIKSQLTIIGGIVLLFFAEKQLVTNLLSQLADLYLVAMLISTMSVILPVFFVESSLKKQFQYDGSRKSIHSETDGNN
ncbi:SdpI family protein [Fibrella arboris]|uniref:SdpI family protein n=1 Tax=Fibrella arboris TaxID=3242486 RepID=UPI00352015B2